MTDGQTDRKTDGHTYVYGLSLLELKILGYCFKISADPWPAPFITRSRGSAGTLTRVKYRFLIPSPEYSVFM